MVNAETAAYLRDFRFTGDIDAYREGDLYFPGSPVLTVSGTLGECVVLETLVLSVLNHDTAIASAAARMTTAAAGRPLVEMGSRRTHEEAAVAVARAAYLAGFDSTSNLAAGRRYGIPTVGTASHAFTLAHESEEAAFRSQVEAHGADTTLLVDTYDVADGIRTAVKVAGPGLGAIRLDSGDLAEESHRARQLLDELGATEHPDHRDQRPRRVRDHRPGRRPHRRLRRRHPRRHRLGPPHGVHGLQAGRGRRRARRRRPDALGRQEVRPEGVGRRAQDRVPASTTATVASCARPSRWAPPTVPGQPLQVAAMRAGRIVHQPTLDEIRAFTAQQVATLPEGATSVAAGPPCLTVTVDSEGASS